MDNNEINKMLEQKNLEESATPKNKIEAAELDDSVIEKAKKDVDAKKGFNGIRPDIDTRLNFAKVKKVLSEDIGKKVSDTEIFKIMLKTYINQQADVEQKEGRTASINFNSNIWHAEYHLGKILDVFRDMQVVAQDTINVANENAEAQIQNKDFEIDSLVIKLETANAKIKVLEEANTKLDDYDNLTKELNDVKAIINVKQSDILQLEKIKGELLAENQAIKSQLLEAEKAITTLEKASIAKDADLVSLAKKNNILDAELNVAATQIATLNAEKSQLENALAVDRNALTMAQDTLSRFNQSKNIEIESINKTHERLLKLEIDAATLELKNTILNLKTEIIELEAKCKTKTTKSKVKKED